MLACFYQMGAGVGVDNAEAFKWYKRAAESEHVEALFALGNLNEFLTLEPLSMRVKR